MRATSIALHSSTSEEPITFSLRDADPTAQYMIRTIAGLDAEEITPRYYATGMNTKPKFYSFKLRPREIVMRIVLKPRFNLDESYGDVRDELYRLISASRTGTITLQIYSGTTLVGQLEGHINRFESVVFTQLPEVQITILCPDPMIKAINPVIMEPQELTNFNPVIIPDSLSTAPHGFHMHIQFTSPSIMFMIQDREADPEWEFRVVPAGGFLAGDVLHLSTDFAENHLFIDRSGTIIHLVDKVQPGSLWPIIFPGSNEFWISEVSDGIFLFDWIDLEYYPAYWGV